jgi:hypothetical protein
MPPAAEGSLNAHGVPVNGAQMHVYQRADGSYAAFGGDNPDALRAFAAAQAVKTHLPITIDRTYSPEPGVTYVSTETFKPPFLGIGPVKSQIVSGNGSLVPKPDDFTKLIR